MKKALVVLLALTCLSAMAFADDVAWTFGMTVKTGAQITMYDSNNGPNTIEPYDADDSVASRLRFDADAALGDSSAHIRVGGDGAGLTAAGVFLPAWWAQQYFLDKMVRLQFGNLDTATTDTVNKGWGGLNVEGAQAVVFPVSGMAFGIAIPAAPKMTLNAGLAGTKLGFSYTMTDLVTIKATYSNAGGDKLSDFAAGVAVLAVPNLTAQLEVQDTDLGSKVTVLTSTFGFKSGGIELFENFAYVMGALTPGLEMYQVIPGDTSLKMSMYFKPNIDFMVMTGTNIGISIKYTMKPYFGLTGSPDSALAVDPYVKFTFNDKAKVKIDANYTLPDLSDTSTWVLPININFMYSY